MATPELAIAKTALLASLLRAPPPSSTSSTAPPPACSRTDADAFHALLDGAIARCSATNVQKCKNWIIENVSPAPNRATALAKFLAALVKTFASQGGGKRDRSQLSPRRKALHLLYIVNDVLHHTTARIKDDTFVRALEPFAPAIIYSAGSFPGCPKHAANLAHLLELWNQNTYFSSEIWAKLSDAATKAPVEVQRGDGLPGSDAAQAAGPAKPSKDMPYMLPPAHGDPSVAWYDLPAGNWLPQLVPNSTKPMDPSMIRPLQFAAGPANAAVADAVRSLLADVDRIFSRPGGATEDVDAHIVLNDMGERTVLDEVTGDVIGGETYYGWSREFCRKMKVREKGPPISKPGGNPGRERREGHSASSLSRSRSRARSRDSDTSRGSSRPALKRRRLSSTSRDRSSSRSRSRRRDGDGSKGRNDRSRDSRRDDHSRSRSRGQSRSKSVSRDNNARGSSRRSTSRSRSGKRHENTSQSRSRSRSYSPDRRQSRKEYRERSYSPRQSRSRSRHRSGSRSGPQQHGTNQAWDPNAAMALQQMPQFPPVPPFPGFPQMAAAMAAIPGPWNHNFTANPFPDVAPMPQQMGNMANMPNMPNMPWWPVSMPMPVPPHSGAGGIPPPLPPPPPPPQSGPPNQEFGQQYHQHQQYRQQGPGSHRGGRGGYRGGRGGWRGGR